MSELSLMSIMKENGVSDLPNVKIKGFFAKALRAERLGDDEAAAEFLAKAIEEEEKYNAN